MCLLNRKNLVRRPARSVRCRGRRPGNALIEMVVVLGLLLTLSFGTIEFGCYFFVKHTLTGAAREGARAAIVPGATQAQVTSAVSNVMTAAGLSNSGYTIVTTPSDITTSTTGSPITVTVQCTWGTVGNGYRPMGLIGAAKTVSGTAVMRDEG